MTDIDPDSILELFLNKIPESELDNYLKQILMTPRSQILQTRYQTIYRTTDNIINPCHYRYHSVKKKN